MDSAYDLMKDTEALGSQSALLRAITLTIKGHEDRNAELLEQAANLFKTFGDSPTDCGQFPWFLDFFFQILA